MNDLSFICHFKNKMQFDPINLLGQRVTLQSFLDAGLLCEQALQDLGSHEKI